MNARERAYVDGFCKAAEAVGVDPRRLAVKEAALGKSAAGAGTMVGRALGAVGRGFRRYGQLLRGGNPALVGPYREAWARTKAFNNQLADMRGMFTGRPVGPVARAASNAVARTAGAVGAGIYAASQD